MVVIRRRTSHPSGGPTINAAGRPIASDHAIVRPMSAWSRSIAASGPGCGGTSACEADKPATSGSPRSSSGSFSRRASVNTIGASRTRPTLKKTGRPTTNATKVRTQCTCRTPNRPISRSATTSAPPDSASILPRIVPSPMTTAMNPRVLPTPSWNARTTESSGMPDAAPTNNEMRVRATKALSRAQAMSRTSPTIAAAVHSSRACCAAVTP